MSELTSVGIIGDGQLSLMLTEAAIKLGLRPFVFATAAGGPASAVCPDVIIGHREDETSLRGFFSKLSVAAFENEFVDTAALGRAAAGLGVRFTPSLETIARLQNKLGQKTLLSELGVPTPEFYPLDLDVGAEDAVRNALSRFGGSCVLKWSRLGYDGKGVHFASDEGISAATEFVVAAHSKGNQVFAEACVRFKRELAILGVYSINGEFASYPLVITEQENGICNRVFGPATAAGVNPALDAIARGYAKKIAEATDLHGVFAIEFFETADGELLVNEIAPRVHNSGHYTQDACGTSQFENHWRALLGMPLGSTGTTEIFAMKNILGPDGVTFDGPTPPLPEPGDESIRLYWYGKKEIRHGRKLGHLNVAGKSAILINDFLNALDDCVSLWSKKFK